MKTKDQSLSRREFLRVAGTGVVGGLLTFPGLSGWTAPLTTVSQSRLDRLSKGANVCRWFRFVIHGVLSNAA
ncbi:MAG: hypothetical protein M1608_05685 [Candidatus Omnitrophica bacterium]|nr:hypothetical protein [Candidatus Omnitrophota bacterium]